MLPSGAAAVFAEEGDPEEEAVETCAGTDSSWMDTGTAVEAGAACAVPLWLAASSAVSVFLPASPSAVRRFRYWKATTASSVFRPKIPSAFPER